MKNSQGYIDIILGIIVILFLALVRADYVVTAAYFITIIYIVLTNRYKLLYRLGISTLMALIWTISSIDYYGYENNYITIFGVNIFPLFAWSLGLFAVYILYSNFEEYIPVKSYISKLLITIVVYWIVLLTLETIAYHSWGVHNAATSAYPGLPLCNCLHAPVWMQAIYLLMGPLYLLILHFSKLDHEV